jgi:hypothetical protein
MRTPIPAAALTVCLLVACSQSSMQSAVDGANALSVRFMSTLVEKDASHQTEGLIRNLDPRPDCQPYINRLREAGHGSPYEGATEWTVVHTYSDAGKAGCVKPNISPGDNTVGFGNAVSSKLMSNLVEKDASHQVEGLIRNLDPRPDCQPYINRLREVGHGSPYAGATQWAIAHTYGDAGKAGCIRPD